MTKSGLWRARLDGTDTRFGSVQAARRAMRTIFLGSAPAVSHQRVRGITLEHILLGCAQPGQTVGIFEDVLKRLRDCSHYLYAERHIDQDRFWLDTRPNLRREMESRTQSIDEREELEPLLKTQVSNLFARQHSFAGIHVFTPSVDVPDEYGAGVRLVVLPPQAAYAKSANKAAFAAAEEILSKRGEQPRQKQNRLLFIAGDNEVMRRFKEQGRTYLAWKSIISDIDNGKLNLDLFQVQLARKNVDAAEQSLKQLAREAYKWLLCPTQDMSKGKPSLQWEVLALSANTPNLIADIEQKLREEEWLITQWSPVHLRTLLNQWYFKDGVQQVSALQVSALKVWQDCCHYVYLPRIANDKVFIDALNQGLASEDYFGFTAGQDGEQYLGFTFGKPALVVLDAASLLIQREAAVAYRESIKPPAPPPSLPPLIDSDPDPIDPKPPIVPQPPVLPATTLAKTRFYASITLDPLTAKLKFAQIMDEVVQQFTTRTGVHVSIALEIEATAATGFGAVTIKPNQIYPILRILNRFQSNALPFIRE